MESLEEELLEDEVHGIRNTGYLQSKSLAGPVNETSKCGFSSFRED